MLMSRYDHFTEFLKALTDQFSPNFKTLRLSESSFKCCITFLLLPIHFLKAKETDFKIADLTDVQTKTAAGLFEKSVDVKITKNYI